MKRSLIDRVIYAITKKPNHYIEVKNPPKTVSEKLSRPQDARQVQYNEWSRRHQVFSGSYLPYQAKDLINNGWDEKSLSKNKYETELVRRSTGQHVLRHGRHINKNGEIEPTHYHWKNKKDPKLSKKQHQNVYYFDKYGNTCPRGSEESHLKPKKKRKTKK
ncbi:MAG: hypothetical protein J6L90_04250 [Clostridia bacterium]|nr:hypothetical protein [Clostridia bacterium]